MYVVPQIPLTSSATKPIYRPKTRSPATTATALARPPHSVEAAAAAIHHLTAITVVAHLPLGVTAPVAMTTVAVPHLVMTTTLATAATVLHLRLAPLVHLSTITHHPLVAATAKILTALHLAVDTRIRMQLTDMIGLGLERLRGLMADTMSVLRHRDTGDCSSSFLCKEPLMGGSRL